MKSFIEKKLAPHNQNKRCKRKGKKNVIMVTKIIAIFSLTYLL